MRSYSFQESVVISWSFGTQQNIGMGVIENLPITQPPLDEQSAIADYIAKQLDRWDRLIAEGVRSVELLQERRSALISAAVTGKIDVRGWQPPASAQPPELAVAEAV
jgi:type I restriction enzyme S subunit